MGICRFPAPVRHENRDKKFRENVMGWIEQQATEAWAPEEEGAKAQAAVDFLTVEIKPVRAPVPPLVETEETEPRTQWTQSNQPSSSTNADQNLGQASGHGRRHGRYTDGPSTSQNERVQPNRRRTERQVEKQRDDVVG